MTTTVVIASYSISVIQRTSVCKLCRWKSWKLSGYNGMVRKVVADLGAKHKCVSVCCVHGLSTIDSNAILCLYVPGMSITGEFGGTHSQCPFGYA